MPSQARSELQERLRDVDELVAAHAALTGGGVGKPAKRQGAAITRAGVVLLNAALEGYVEDLFKESAGHVLGHASPQDINEFFQSTVENFNTPKPHKIEMLFFHLGIPWCLQSIKWKKFPNDAVEKGIRELVTTRGDIAHGKRPSLRLSQLRRWKKIVEGFSPKLEDVIRAHIERVTGNGPNW